MRLPRIIVILIGLFRMLSYLFKEYKINNSLCNLNTFGRYWHISFHNTENHSPVSWNSKIYKCLNFQDSICFCCTVAQLCPVLCSPMDCSTPGFPVLHYLLEFVQTQVHWVSDAIQPSHPLLTPSPPALHLSQHQDLFQWITSLHQVASSIGAWASVLPVDSWLISVRIDWFDLHAIQGTLKSLLQHHSSKASFLWHSAFFVVQLSHLYMTTGKTITLTRQTFVSKMMSLLFSMLF